MNSIRRWSGLVPLVMIAAAGVTVASAEPGPFTATTPGPGTRAAPEPPTLEFIMRDQEWVARSPADARWGDDSAKVYYWRKRPGSDLRDLWVVPVAGGDQATPVVIGPAAYAQADWPGSWSRDRTKKVWSREGDLYLKDLASQVVTQLTRTADAESRPEFMADGERIMYRRGTAVYVRDLRTGVEVQPVEALAQKPPEDPKPPKKLLATNEDRLMESLRDRRERREEEEKEQKAARWLDAARMPVPVYLGDDVELRGIDLSPTGEWAVIRAAKKGRREAKADAMPSYVTTEGYVTSRPVRGKVAAMGPEAMGGEGGQRSDDSLFLVDLRPGARSIEKPNDGWVKLDLAVLPGIDEDPLAAIRPKKEEDKPKEDKPKDDKPKDDKSAEATDKADEKEIARDGTAIAEPVKPEAKSPSSENRATRENRERPEKKTLRPVAIGTVNWSQDGRRAAFQAVAGDNKDRWIAEIDLAGKKVRPLERLTDDAWVNRAASDWGFVAEEDAIWFESEESGYSQVYVRSLTAEGTRRPISRNRSGSAEYEASSAYVTRDGKWLYFRAGTDRPTTLELFRVPIGGDGTIEQLTRFGGVNDFIISPDEKRVLVTHSTMMQPPDLWVFDLPVPGSTGGKPLTLEAGRRLTETMTPEFAAIEWVKPRVLAVPGRDGHPLWSRVYMPPAGAPPAADSGRPAVVFVHGAGYLQNAHEGWSYYQREFMFHSLLARRGVVVLDMDYRASAGYGRDWRTAIYRQMGTPELEDLEDGVSWLVREQGVDPARVGVYGGSYGGFLTLMALFTRPELFACGAALRPVTDWAHYSDAYTANILNTPADDPEAYRRSSPIEFASGLEKPLLICHGMLDDNVFFQDTVRLTQRLIELKKTGWEVAMYPVEAHAFRDVASWFDEYRRILELFEEHLHLPR